MAGFRIEGNTSGNVAEVNNANELKVSLSTTQPQAGYGVNLYENDDGTFAGTDPRRMSPSVSSDKRLSVGIDTPFFDYAFTATAQDTAVWRHYFTTMTATQTAGYLNLNANNTVAAATGASLSTWRQFSMVNNGGMRLAFVCGPTLALPANQVVEFGWFGTTTPTVAPTEGVYFRITSAGIVGVINFNGTEVTTGVLNSSLISPGSTSEYQIRLYTDSVSFYMANKYLGSLDTPAGNPQATMTSAFPATVQMRNSGTVTGPAQWKVGHISVDGRDTQMVMGYETQQAAMGLMGSQVTSGGTMGSTALYSNSLAVGAGAAMTNTAATLGSGLGGQFSTQPTLAVPTDGIVCSYQVPAGSTIIRPRTLVIRGVKIHSAVTSALTGGPVLYAYSLAYGHTAVSMATAESTTFTTNTAKAPRRVALGFESHAVTAAAGALGSPAGISMTFAAPIFVNPGEFVAITAKNVGVVTTAGVITFLVTFDAFWM